MPRIVENGFATSGGLSKSAKVVLGCGAREVPPCHGARWRRAILDTMTVQDLRLEIGRDGITKAGISRGAKAACAGCCTAGAN